MIQLKYILFANKSINGCRKFLYRYDQVSVDINVNTRNTADITKKCVRLCRGKLFERDNFFGNYRRYRCFWEIFNLCQNLCLYVMLSGYLLVYLCISLPVCLYVYLSNFLSGCLSACPLFYLSVWCAVLPVRLSTDSLSVYLSVCSSIFLSVFLCLSIHRVLRLE